MQRETRQAAGASSGVAMRSWSRKFNIRKPLLSSTDLPEAELKKARRPSRLSAASCAKNSITLAGIRQLGTVDHVWFWNGREVRERAWLFLADSSDYARLSRGECPQLIEADGQCMKTVWRPIEDDIATLPPLCPSGIADFLK